MDLSEFTESECACAKCVDACKRPCWPTPAEARAIVDAGQGDKLMLDYWHGSATGEGADGSDEDVQILCGANPGYEGRRAPEIPPFLALMGMVGDLTSGCAFLDDDGKCTLHGTPLKPSEGRLALPCTGRTEGLHQAVAATWETDEGRALVADWLARRP